MGNGPTQSDQLVKTAKLYISCSYLLINYSNVRSYMLWQVKLLISYFLCARAHSSTGMWWQESLSEKHTLTTFCLWHMYFKESSLAIKWNVNRKPADFLQLYSLFLTCQNKAAKLLNRTNHKNTEQKVPPLRFKVVATTPEPTHTKTTRLQCPFSWPLWFTPQVHIPNSDWG